MPWAGTGLSAYGSWLVRLTLDVRVVARVTDRVRTAQGVLGPWEALPS